eukprot:14131400-Ditylum_brightwellii.AAC.1
MYRNFNPNSGWFDRRPCRRQKAFLHSKHTCLRKSNETTGPEVRKNENDFGKASSREFSQNVSSHRN